MRNDFGIVSNDGSEPTFSFRYSVAAIIENVNVQSQVAKHLKIGDQLIGEHGIALDHKKVALGIRRRQLIASQLRKVSGLEADLFKVFYLRDAFRVRRSGHTAP